MSTVRAAPRVVPAAPVEAAPPALRVVESTPRPRTTRTPVGALGVVLVGALFVALFGVVTFQVLLVQSQSHLDSLDGQVRAEEARAKELQRETADLESPDRIVAAARDRLNMLVPSTVVHLQPGAEDSERGRFDPKTTTTVPTTRPAPPPTTAVPSTKASNATTPTSKATSPTTKSTTATTKSTPPTTKRSTATTKVTTPTTKSSAGR